MEWKRDTRYRSRRTPPTNAFRATTACRLLRQILSAVRLRPPSMKQPCVFPSRIKYSVSSEPPWVDRVALELRRTKYAPPAKERTHRPERMWMPRRCAAARGSFSWQSTTGSDGRSGLRWHGIEHDRVLLQHTRRRARASRDLEDRRTSGARCVLKKML